MYSVCVRDHRMVAHSFRGEVFGPAQRLHGATFVVDVEFRRPDLDADGIVVDIGRASTTLHAVLAELTIATSNPPSRGGTPTTEFFRDRILTRWWRRSAAAISARERARSKACGWCCMSPTSRGRRSRVLSKA